jgi:hypothetical protein
MESVHDVVGYVLCVGCDEELVLDIVAGRTGGLCTTCFRLKGTQLRHIEVEARGARIPVRLGRPGRKRVRSTPSAEAKAREKTVDKCRERARKRLQAVFPDLYDIFLADERAAAGLDPWPLSMALRSGPDPDGSQTEAFARLYHLLEDRGVDA